MKNVKLGKNFARYFGKKICALTLAVSSLTFNICAAEVSYGDNNDEVLEVETCLYAQGLFNGAVDGYCDTDTVAAIKDFQTAINLPVTGICDDKTFAILHAAAYDEIDITTLMNDNLTNYLKPGDSGAKVTSLQESLIELGYLNGTADGVYGGATAKAVKSFQATNNLRVDGLCNGSVFNALKKFDVRGNISGGYAEIGSVIKKGMHGPGVVDVQNKLIDAGYMSGTADGVFGDTTIDALKRFQADRGMKADGVCGIMTYAALENAQYEVEDVDLEKPFSEIPKFKRSVYVEATAYSSQDPGLGLYTTRGSLVGHGIISVDPNFIPLGTRVYIPGYGEAIADDTGGAIVGNRIDIAFDTYDEAINFGRKEIEIYIIEE